MDGRGDGLIANSLSPIGDPGRIIGAIDQQGDRPTRLFAIGLLLLGLGEICRRVDQFLFFPVGSTGTLQENLEFVNGESSPA